MDEPMRVSFECLINEKGEQFLFVPKDQWKQFAESAESYIFIPKKS